MGFDDPRFREIFYDLYAWLPRAGPGDDESTERALGLCEELVAAPRALDVGCGPGRQTLVLARRGARVIGLDDYRPFLGRLRAAAAEAGLADRIEPVQADMAALPLPDARFDLVWSEGAAYQMGTEAACTAWRALLRDPGYLALTEACRLRDELPAEVERCWADEGLELLDVDGVLALVARAGYDVVGHFVLPESSWWRQYYTPLEQRIPLIERRYAGDPAAAAVVAGARTEIETYRTHADCYGYVFVVARRA
ncbi:MAG: class I SAM-dependent methyltransferase [Myxococcota bacterium]|nr:class I SAM-dependent methyltransferase [Myxococcota bacterium]